MAEKPKKRNVGINKELNGEAINPIQNTIPEEERTIAIATKVSQYEKEFIDTITSILSKLEVADPNSPDGGKRKILAKNEVSELIRTCITFTCNAYLVNVFPDTSLVNGLPDRESIKEFVAFRKKYMNFPIDAQLNQLKVMGIVKSKQQTQTAGGQS